jgi:PAS domain S-box-containing protein
MATLSAKYPRMNSVEGDRDLTSIVKPLVDDAIEQAVVKEIGVIRPFALPLNIGGEPEKRELSKEAISLSQPEQEFPGFFEAAPDAVVITNRDGRIIRINGQSEMLFGYARAELVGQLIETLMPERFRRQHVAQRTTYFANPATRPMGTGGQLYGLRKDGSEFAAEISLSPFASENGIVIASAIRDVTKQRRLEEELRLRTQELENAARHKDEYLGMLAHELRSPLGAIRNAAQVLKHLGPSYGELPWVQDIIGRQSDHMAHLIEDLLDASRIAHGKVRIRKETVELRQIVNQAVETCQPLFQARRQTVCVSLPTHFVTLSADPMRLIQIVTNLLNNAAKYTDEGGQIWLSASDQDGELVLRVRDDGVGISAESLPHVFELFNQVPGALDRSDGGLGIGLAVVGHLVQLHGGTVQAFSDGLKRGSEFIVRLPLPAAARKTRDELRGARRILSTESAPRRILIADDNRGLLHAMAHVLRRRGHEVSVACDGPAALASARTFRPEAVFLDIELPNMSGYEVARRLRKQSGFKSVLLVAATGHPEESIRPLMQDAGFDAYLAKPYGVDELLSLVSQGRAEGSNETTSSGARREDSVGSV